MRLYSVELRLRITRKGGDCEMTNFTMGRSLAVVVGVMMLRGAPAAAHVSRCTSIAQAREAELGSTVSLVGTVTVPSGAFDDGFAIQQGRAGIYIADSAGADYALGDQVRVEGVLANANNLLVVQPSAIERLPRGLPVRAQRRTTGSVGEETEGKLLGLRGTLVGDSVDDSPYGYKLTLDDGSGPVQVFLYPGAGIAPDGLDAGVEVSVICFSNQYDTKYECDPRIASDIAILTPGR
jgi:hypothetical protein